jgi:hypothetical protein
VYADWLEERGDPRAEFVRLDCAVARDPSRSEDRIRRDDLAHGLDRAWVDRVRCRITSDRAVLPDMPEPPAARTGVPWSPPVARVTSRFPRLTRWTVMFVLGLLIALVASRGGDWVRRPPWKDDNFARDHAMPK